MTLKQKFEDIEGLGRFSDPVGYSSWSTRVLDEQSTQCVDVADDFAIGFAEWCTKYRDKNRNVDGEMLHAKSKYDETYLTKELLEMYKKEQKL